MRRESRKFQDQEIEDMCEEPRAQSPCKSTNDVFDPNGKDSDTSSQIARNLRGLEATEHLRTGKGKICKPEDDGDEPTLQSPDPRLGESRFGDNQHIQRA